ncbi:MAG: 4-hydroxy-tetrahydrodipicolinate synthase [Candidatus Omnitrophica bacterium CG11_big_fil_rev_8_21_14_0_20_42_13]|uniref:4-hydroxy-tetrahydrodipicolinate synthase n=1 Tax=Candidatus Ghiorseimicrobium undicola TaxID=1974746 RepID=A0A2H0LW62_9BACT|nr:MAG: 4-hydroxy-tetrahydrodipicolinate synthase [Candidatus Omnitrophica bacterium CG11_big_fil_rev_8_21_14_0_20_42_13]
MLKGSIVALVTPFTDGAKKIDEECLKELVDFHIKGGTDAILTSGTTGESATLDYAEHERVTEICVRHANGRIPVIAGTGSNSTSEAIMLTQHAKKAGAAAALLVSPYYNKPTQKGLYLHFKAIADSVGDFPIILYNIASRTGINIEPETTSKLAENCKNIVAVKEASGNLDQMSRTIGICPKDFILLSGDDSLTLPILSIGGTGVISVVANIIPKEVKAMISAFEKNDIKKAQALHQKMLPLIKAMFIETNPIPVKTAMGLMKMCSPDLRLPMCEMGAENLKKLKRVLKDYRLIK